ncbi:MAG: hypothetical protein ACKOB4_17785 [Acidobacteriota bacterium]
MIEWLSLTGDTADGFEGGFGIGPKGAALLLEQFGSVENALAGWRRSSARTTGKGCAITPKRFGWPANWRRSTARFRSVSIWRR